MDCPRKKRVVSGNLQSQYQKDNRKAARMKGARKK